MSSCRRRAEFKYWSIRAICQHDGAAISYRIQDAAERGQLGLHVFLLAVELGKGELLQVAIRRAGRRRA